MNATYYVVYSGARGAQFRRGAGPGRQLPLPVRQHRDVGDRWPPVRADRDRHGSSDAANGIITINVPASELPAPSADGSEVRLDVSEATSNIIVGSPERLPTPDGAPKQGFVYAADDVGNADFCDAILHEAVTPEV